MPQRPEGRRSGCSLRRRSGFAGYGCALSRHPRRVPRSTSFAGQPTVDNRSGRSSGNNGISARRLPRPKPKSIGRALRGHRARTDHHTGYRQRGSDRVSGATAESPDPRATSAVCRIPALPALAPSGVDDPQCTPRCAVTGGVGQRFPLPRSPSARGVRRRLRCVAALLFLAQAGEPVLHLLARPPRARRGRRTSAKAMATAPSVRPNARLTMSSAIPMARRPIAITSPRIASRATRRETTGAALPLAPVDRLVCEIGEPDTR